MSISDDAKQVYELELKDQLEAKWGLRRSAPVKAGGK